MELSSGKKIMRNTILLYLRMFVMMLISLLTVRLVLRVLGIEDYGIYNAVGGVVTSLSFLTSVLTNASQRFFAVELAKNKENKINKLFSSMIAVYIVICILIVLTLEIGGLWMIDNMLTIPTERLKVAYLVFHVSLATFIVNVLTAPLTALIIAHEKMDIFAYVSLLESIGKLILVCLLYLTTTDKLLAYSLSLFLIAVLVNIFYHFFVYWNIKIKVKLLFDRNIIKSVLEYSSWTLFGTTAGVVNMQGNSILLNIFIGPIANAAFAIANQVSALVQQFSSSFYTAVTPPLTKSFSSGETDYMNNLFWFSSKAMFLLSYIILFPIFIQTEYILKIWLGEVSLHMVNFVRIILVYTLILTMGNPITTIVQAAGKVKLYHSVVDGFSLLVFPTSYVVLKLYNNPELALIGMVVIFSIAHLLRLLVLSNTIDFSFLEYIKQIIFPCLIIVLISIVFTNVAGFYKSEHNNLLPIIYMLISMIFSGGVSFMLLFKKEERIKLLSYIPLLNRRINKEGDSNN